MEIFEQVLVENDLAKLRAAIKKLSAKTATPQTKAQPKAAAKAEPTTKAAPTDSDTIANSDSDKAVEAVRKGNGKLNKYIDRQLKRDDPLSVHINIKTAIQQAAEKLAGDDYDSRDFIDLELTNAAFGYINKKYLGGSDSNYSGSTMSMVKKAMEVSKGNNANNQAPSNRVRADFSWDNDMTNKAKLKEASMNISMNGADAKEVAELIGILKNAGVETHVDMPLSHSSIDSHDDMVSKLKMMDPEPSCGMGEEEVEEWENSPEGSEGDPEYKDQHYMTKDLSGGINKSKKSYSPVAGGDNPMALENSIKDQLRAALSEKLS